ncbi:MAG: GNAT family N-acetyltransferase [Mangrovicoccus sp.]|nr:GNAT family N-acetyltransferase [Mangrovicoccus sp.]
MIQACRIRPYRQSDLPQIQSIAARAFAPIFSSVRETITEPLVSIAYGEAEAEQHSHLAALSETADPRDLLVVECGGDIVGFGHIVLNPSRKIGELGINAIDPIHQGKGYGRKLHKAMLDRMRATGMRVATVGTGVDAAHAPARRAYDRAGFTEQLPSVFLYRPL